jgi:predicted TIM-barrel fold metal-dependent hydrolase
MGTLDDYLGDARQKESGSRKDGTVTFLPDPEPRERRFTIISVDDHIVEPPDMFVGRIPTKFGEAAPHVVDGDDGNQYWSFEGELLPNVGFNAVAGRPPQEWSMEPSRFEHMRKGAWDIDERIRDMDLDGVYAQLNFPSFISGFAGTRFSQARDRELGLAAMRAWNDFVNEEWAGRYPERIIPCQITWLADPEIAAEEIRRNAQRGFKAVSFTENPVGQGLPSLYTDHWDPFLRACEETDTVICLHVGSSTQMPITSPEAPPMMVVNTLLTNAFLAAAEWIWAEVPLRFPGLKLCMSEGGISWVLALFDRLNHIFDRHAIWALPDGALERWTSSELTPAEVFQRSFYFCTFDDPSGMRNLDVIGADHVMLESDYPHSDGCWPDTQRMAARLVDGLPEDEVELITHGNAARIFRHPVNVTG